MKCTFMSGKRNPLFEETYVVEVSSSFQLVTTQHVTCNTIGYYYYQHYCNCVQYSLLLHTKLRTGHISSEKRKPLFEETIPTVASYTMGALLRNHLVSHQT